jgi:hypothetical protein
MDVHGHAPGGGVRGEIDGVSRRRCLLMLLVVGDSCSRLSEVPDATEGGEWQLCDVHD